MPPYVPTGKIRLMAKRTRLPGEKRDARIRNMAKKLYVAYWIFIIVCEMLSSF